MNKIRTAITRRRLLYSATIGTLFAGTYLGTGIANADDPPPPPPPDQCADAPEGELCIPSPFGEPYTGQSPQCMWFEYQTAIPCSMLGPDAPINKPAPPPPPPAP
jgi:hypothetical protein